MGRYRLHKPLCIPQFVLILMLYTMFYVCSDRTIVCIYSDIVVGDCMLYV